MELSSFTTILRFLECHVKTHKENHTWPAPSRNTAAPAKARQRPAQVTTNSGKVGLFWGVAGGSFIHRRMAPRFSTVQKECFHLHKARGKGPEMEKLPFSSFSLFLCPNA